MEIMFLVAIVSIGGFLLYAIVIRPHLATDGDVQDTVVNFLAQPTFSGDEFERKVLGEDVTFDLYDLTQDPPMLSFTVKKNGRSEEELREVVGTFLKDPANVQTDQNDEELWWFSTPKSNFQVDPDQKLEFAYERALYDISLRELSLNLNNVGMYGGKMQAVLAQYGRSVRVMASHGVYVSKPGNPSVQRMVEKLLKDGPEKREEKIQTLFDFVANQIEYNGLASISSVELMKRAPETLMTGEGDCSNKAILFASMLEQTEEDYLLVYFGEHIAVAVEIGDFSPDNGWSFDWDGKAWVVCETTAEGFVIGQSILEDEFSIESVRYIQRPREKNTIYDAKTGRKLLFTTDLH